MNHILIIEDETNVRTPLIEYLQREGFRVSGASTLAEGDAKLKEAPDLILLDWMLPDGQGIESLKKWRAKNLQTPVILLTARAELIDKVLGLELGGNDFVTKPFEPRELVARIRVQLRARQPSQGAPGSIQPAGLSLGGITLNVSTVEVFYLGNLVAITKTEFELLKMFLENPNQVFSREELLKKVWGYDQFPSTRTVDTHVLQLRQKFRPEMFETVHGIGYRFREKS
jgi:DNA-binding response OmpR family regulator